MDLDADGVRRLAVGILLSAVKDLQRGQHCDGCCVKYHVCADDARRFLAGPWAAVLVESLNLPDGALEHLLAEYPETERLQLALW
jgi:hypothetical protein